MYMSDWVSLGGRMGLVGFVFSLCIITKVAIKVMRNWCNLNLQMQSLRF